MLSLQGVSYALPNRQFLFKELSLSLRDHEKIALVGNNGTGKSTLLKIIAGKLAPTSGTVYATNPAYYVPQVAGAPFHNSIAATLGIDKKLGALRAILSGNYTDNHLEQLADDWGVEERAAESLARWGLSKKMLDAPMASCSGGEQMRVLLAGIQLQGDGLILLDEPSNHLDLRYRQQLLEYIRTTHDSLLVVSHDRSILRALDTICEITGSGIVTYGGSFDFYQAQKKTEAQARENDLHATEKALRKAREKERESKERQQKLDARGKKKQEKAGLPTISMNTFRNNAENSTARLQAAHQAKMETLRANRNQLLSTFGGPDQMELAWGSSEQHTNRVLVECMGINHRYNGHLLWHENQTVAIKSFDRFAITGNNGSGKSTLLKFITGELEPAIGSIRRVPMRAMHLDQDYSLLQEQLTVVEQAALFNELHLADNEIRRRLTRFLFVMEQWDLPVKALSGGEKMRLALCCLLMKATSPDLLVLDEPTNNLDLLNISILATALRNYRGSLLVVSHDVDFLKEIGIEQTISLESA